MTRTCSARSLSLLENGQRFDPDVRLDSLDVLRTQRRGPRRAPHAVRRGALGPQSRRAHEGARSAAGIRAGPRRPRRRFWTRCESDDNSGVRVEAINLLVDRAAIRG